MISTSRSSMEEKIGQKEGLLDVEAGMNSPYEGGFQPLNSPRNVTPKPTESQFILLKIMSYPSRGSLQIRSTSWLDGVRGVAALCVYIFHTIVIWKWLVPAWHADASQNNLLQFPVIRTFFVTGGTAVSLFFAISGYVLTQKSLRWMREGNRGPIYPAVYSSMFRRGWRLFIPPVLLTFFEMIATRFGYVPPLNFEFVSEKTFAGELTAWLSATNTMVNPFFNFVDAIQGFRVHPRYDGVVWTMPIEFWGSFVCYGLLLAFGRIPGNTVRMCLLGVFPLSSLALGSWNNFCFSAGMLIADFNLAQEKSEVLLASRRKLSLLWTVIFAAGFYLAGFPTFVTPESKTNPMPGFEIIRSFTPWHLNMQDHARFWWSISGVSLLTSISQLPHYKRFFESDFCQYLGKISFMLYLVHEFCIILFGLLLRMFMMRITGVEHDSGTFGYWFLCVVWHIVFTFMVFTVAGLAERCIDAPSVKFAKWLETKCLKIYRGM